MGDFVEPPISTVNLNQQAVTDGGEVLVNADLADTETVPRDELERTGETWHGPTYRCPRCGYKWVTEYCDCPECYWAGMCQEEWS